MKLYCEVNVKDRSPMSKFDAIAYACKHDELWKYRETRQDKRLRIMQKTNLKNKCGSCRFFRPITENGEDTCYGNCSQGRVTRPRTTKACTSYEVEK